MTAPSLVFSLLALGSYMLCAAFIVDHGWIGVAIFGGCGNLFVIAAGISASRPR